MLLSRQIREGNRNNSVNKKLRQRLIMYILVERKNRLTKLDIPTDKELPCLQIIEFVTLIPNRVSNKYNSHSSGVEFSPVQAM